MSVSCYLLCMYICVSVSPSRPLVCVGQLVPIVYVYLWWCISMRERYQSWYLLCMYICGGASPCDRLERYQSWYLLCMYICVSVSPSLPLVCVGQLLPIVYVYLCVSQSFASFSLCRSAGTYCVCIFVCQSVLRFL